MPKYRDGDHLTYEFFSDLFERRPELGVEFADEFAARLAVWLPVEVYRRCPVLLPWVVRDSECRRNAAQNRPEQWGAPNDCGYFRDDNSMVKNLARNVPVRGPRESSMNEKCLGRGWVASHIWRSHNGNAKAANTDPMLNTFVPNLVWLPRQIAKLSDRDMEPVQTALKQYSRAIYGNVEVEPKFASLVQDEWAKLPDPERGLEINLSKLNWLDVPENFVDKRRRATRHVVDAIECIAEGRPITRWRVCHRYVDGLPSINRDKLIALAERLRPHAG